LPGPDTASTPSAGGKRRLKERLLRLERLAPLAALLLVAGIAAWAGWFQLEAAHNAGIVVPINQDAPRWGAATILADMGRPTRCPPLFPTCAARLAWGQAGFVAGALRSNALSFSLAVLLVSLGAALPQRRPLAFAAAAVLAAVLAATGMDLLKYSFFYGPEMVTLAALCAVSAAGALLARHSRWWAALLFGVACGVALAAREHGLVVAAACLPAAAVLARGGWKRRLALCALAFLGLELGTGILGGQWLYITPTGQGWGSHGTLHKGMVPLLDLFHASTGQDIDRHWFEEPAAAGSSGGLSFLKGSALQALEISRPYRAPILTALGGLTALLALRRWRVTLGLMVAMLPLLASYVVFSEERHVLVAVGSLIALAVAGGAALAERLHARIAPALLLLAAPFVWLAGVQDTVTAWESHAAHVARDQQHNKKMEPAAAWLRQHAEPGSVLVGSQEAQVMAGLPPRTVQRSKELPAIARMDYYPSWNWRTWVLTSEVLGEPWERHFAADGYAVYRLPRPEGVSQRCLFGAGNIMYYSPMGLTELMPAEGCGWGGGG